jgi:hypothetical protein
MVDSSNFWTQTWVGSALHLTKTIEIKIWNLRKGKVWPILRWLVYTAEVLRHKLFLIIMSRNSVLWLYDWDFLHNDPSIVVHSGPEIRNLEEIDGKLYSSVQSSIAPHIRYLRLCGTPWNSWEVRGKLQWSSPRTHHTELPTYTLWSSSHTLGLFCTSTWVATQSEVTVPTPKCCMCGASTAYRILKANPP